MAAIGLKMSYVGIKNADSSTAKGDAGLSESGVYPINTNKADLNLGLKSANISNMAGTATKIMGNNQVVDVAKVKGTPSVAIDANYINPIAKNKMLGRVQQEDGGWVDSDDNVEVGLIIESQSPISFKSVYFAFGRGIMTEPTQNVSTNTENAQTREDDNLTFTSLGYDKFGGNAMAHYDAQDPKFDVQKMFDTVFPGNTWDAEAGKPKASSASQGN